ncbi:endospore germination permease [Cohnella sp.]|uniref:GerAB/ArcD/ProY family transporter n=1 Tax=Cohnella sp. TaxID=1883426 RepID=UPI003566260B
MKSFEYGDNEISTKEVFAIVSNMLIGFGVLTLPRSIVTVTKSVDGWISICIGGVIAAFFLWVIAKLVSRFPKKGFYDITTAIINKPAANILTLMISVYTMMFVCYETRGLASIARLYLYDRTPEEVICLVFLLVLIYGVSGPSIALLRVNLMFMPIVISIVLVLIFMNIGFFNYHQLKPFFITEWVDVVKASKETVFSFLGFEVLLFYNVHINQPKKTVKAALFGISIPFILYLVVFIFLIGTFGVEVVSNTLYPTAELAKQVEITGGFLERFESLFFTIWVMTLFNTASMAFDVTILGLMSVFKKAKRMPLILFLSPLMYIIIMLPQNIKEIASFGEWISYAGIPVAFLLPLGLFLTAKIRGVKGNA